MPGTRSTNSSFVSSIPFKCSSVCFQFPRSCFNLAWCVCLACGSSKKMYKEKPQSGISAQSQKHSSSRMYSFVKVDRVKIQAFIKNVFIENPQAFFDFLCTNVQHRRKLHFTILNF